MITLAKAALARRRNGTERSGGFRAMGRRLRLRGLAEQGQRTQGDRVLRRPGGDPGRRYGHGFVFRDLVALHPNRSASKRLTGPPVKY